MESLVECMVKVIWIIKLQSPRHAVGDNDGAIILADDDIRWLLKFEILMMSQHYIRRRRVVTNLILHT